MIPISNKRKLAPTNKTGESGTRPERSWMAYLSFRTNMLIAVSLILISPIPELNATEFPQLSKRMPAPSPNLAGITTQDDQPIVVGEDVLSQRRYPWYQPETDQVRSIELKQRSDAISRNRNEIRLAKTKNKKKNGAGGGGGGGTPGNGFSIFVWTGIALLFATIAGVIIWFFFRLESQKIGAIQDGLPSRSLADSILHLPFQVDQKTGDFRSLAEAARAAGDYRKAIIYLFSHVLVTLDQKGLIRLKQGKTNRQYLGELRTHRSLSNFFQRVMVPFESTFFGDHDLSQSEFESCWIELDQFQSGVSESSQVAP